MKTITYILPLFCIFCISNLLIAQKREYPVKLPTLNFLSYQYTIGAEITGYGKYKITLKDSIGVSKEISLSPFSIDKFREAIRAEFKQLTISDPKIHKKYFTLDSIATRTELKQIFFAFKIADIAIEDLGEPHEALKCYFEDDVWVWKTVAIPNKKIRHMIKNIRYSTHHNYSKQINLLIKKLTRINSETDSIKDKKELDKYLNEIINSINELVLNKTYAPESALFVDEFNKIKSAVNTLKHNTINLHDLKVIVYEIERVLNNSNASDPINDWYYYKESKEGKYIYQGNGYKKRKAKQLLKKQWIDREYGKKVAKYNGEKIKNDELSNTFKKSEKKLKGSQNEMISTKTELSKSESDIKKISEIIDSLNLNTKDVITEINDIISKTNEQISKIKTLVINPKTKVSKANYGKLLESINSIDLKKIDVKGQYNLDSNSLKNYQDILKKYGNALKNANSIDLLINNELIEFKDSSSEADSDAKITSVIENPKLDSLKNIKDEIVLIDKKIESIPPFIEGLLSIEKEKKRHKDSLKDLEKERDEYIALLNKNNKTLKEDQTKHNENTTGLILSNSLLSNIKTQFPKVDLNISEIEMEINDGFIENISVIGNISVLKEAHLLNDTLSVNNPLKDKDYYNSKKIKFENYAPIGFSRKNDFRKFHLQYLFGELLVNNEIVKYELNLSAIFPLINEKLAVDRRDYSPKNQYVSIDPKNSKDKFISLKKETTAKLFEAKVYSDFVGFDESNPNGLIQTEVHKYIPINTRRVTINKPRWQWINFGFFGYMEPFVVISKIENTSKNLKISNIDRFIDGKYAPIKYASTLEIKRHQSFSTGFTFNAITLDFPFIKSTILFNLAFSYGITPAEDTIKRVENNELITSDALDEYKINTYTATGPEIIWEIRSDERYGFNIIARWDFYWARTNRVIQVSNEEVFRETRDTGANVNWLNSIELNGYLKTSDTSSGRLFFRFRYNWQKNYWKTGFNQLQVGYSFYILKKSES